MKGWILMPPMYPKSGNDPVTSEQDYSDEERVFMLAMQRYKDTTGRRFPGWSEVLKVAHSLGYRKVAEESDVPTFKRGPDVKAIIRARQSSNGKGIRTEQGEESCTGKTQDGTK